LPGQILAGESDTPTGGQRPPRAAEVDLPKLRRPSCLHGAGRDVHAAVPKRLRKPVRLSALTAN
jgi:hypothetical protein